MGITKGNRPKSHKPKISNMGRLIPQPPPTRTIGNRNVGNYKQLRQNRKRPKKKVNLNKIA